MYSSILLKALADRLAEAFAERMHERVRKELWAYAPDERLTNDQLVSAAYRGIRPPPGCPACPDHTAKDTWFPLLGAEAATAWSSPIPPRLCRPPTSPAHTSALPKHQNS